MKARTISRILSCLALFASSLLTYSARPAAAQSVDHAVLQGPLAIQPLHPDCVSNTTLTVSDLPPAWQEAVIKASQTWNGVQAVSISADNTISDQTREFQASDFADHPIDNIFLARCEIRVMRASQMPKAALDTIHTLTNDPGWTQPYRAPESPQTTIAALVFLNDLPVNFDVVLPLDMQHRYRWYPPVDTETIAMRAALCAVLPTECSTVDVETIALHELGHALGLTHTPDRLQTMSQDWGTQLFKLNIASRWLWMDIDRLNSLYPQAYSMSYRIKSLGSNKVLYVRGDSQADGMPIVQSGYLNSFSQYWYFEPAGDGYFFIHSVASRKCLDVAGSVMNDGARIVQNTCIGSDSQKWQMRAEENVSGIVIRSKHSEKVLDVRGASTEDYAPIIQYAFHGDNQNQQWLLETDHCYTYIQCRTPASDATPIPTTDPAAPAMPDSGGGMGWWEWGGCYGYRQCRTPASDATPIPTADPAAPAMPDSGGSMGGWSCLMYGQCPTPASDATPMPTADPAAPAIF
jgi:Ricin-type beta-trefoil lectin domain-like/Matrixin